MGDTDVAKQAAKITKLAHHEFFWFCDEEIYASPIFEYTSPYNQIVVPYEDERLSLLAVRHWKTGEYYSYEQLLKWGKLFGFDVVKQYDRNEQSVLDFIEDKKSASGEEGIILSSACGYYKVKVKNEWYVRIHKALERIVHEKDILQMILEEKLDDVIPFLSVTLANKVRDYEIAFWKNVRKVELEIEKTFLDYEDLPRKEFALEIKGRRDAKFLFKLKDLKEKYGNYDHDAVHNILMDFLTTFTTSSKLEHNRWLIGTEWRMNSEDFQ
jgi:RNA ligase